MSMNITYKNVSSLKKYDKNSRKHSKEQIEQVCNSIKEFGFTNPILVDETNTIIAGHCRLEAATALGFSEVPVIELNHLTEAQKRAYVIADNKLALNSSWDIELLKNEVYDLIDLDFNINLLGFNTDELKNEILCDYKEETFVNEDEDADDTSNVDSIVPKSKHGDVWLLGNHRLMCGDSTDANDVKKLMNGSVADLGFCDPPYNLGFEYNSYDDNKTDSEYREFSNKWFKNLKDNTERQIITLGTKNLKLMLELGDNLAGVACWVKKNWITSCHIAKLQQWEPIVFYCDYTKLKRASDLYEINRVIQKDVGDNHTCPKQIELMKDIIEHYSTNKVVDLFGGSGTTLIACEMLKRNAFLMEFDPKYVDFIISRWEKATGKKAINEETNDYFSL